MDPGKTVSLAASLKGRRRVPLLVFDGVACSAGALSYERKLPCERVYTGGRVLVRVVPAPKNFAVRVSISISSFFRKLSLEA